MTKGRFEQGDTPQGSDYVDLIDSYMSLADTTAQSLSSPLSVAGALSVSTAVSAANGEFGALTVTGNAVVEGDLEVEGTIQFAAVSVGELYLNATAAVSASATYVELITTASSLPIFLVNFEVSAGSLVYTGTATSNFIGHLSVTMAASANNTETFVTLGVNASAITRIEEIKEFGLTDNELSMHGMLNLRTGERVSPMIRTDAGGASGWAVKRLVMTVKE